MSWPRFRGRNGLISRPNYYSPSAEGSPQTPVNTINSSVDRTYLSGEIDRMVYGWWLNPVFQDAVSEHVGVTRQQVNSVIECMLMWDYPEQMQTQWPAEEVPS